MLRVLKNTALSDQLAAKPSVPLRSFRPSLLDLRFTGDPWIVDHADGAASVRLDNYRVAQIQTTPFDLPSLNQLLFQLRQWQVRRRYYQLLRARSLHPSK